MTLAPADIQALVTAQVPESARQHPALVELLSGARLPALDAGGVLTFAPHYLSEDFAGFTAEELVHMAQQQATSFMWAAKARTVEWLVKSFAPGAMRVLDIGCGTGFITRVLAETLPGAAILATDVFAEGVKLTGETLAGQAFVFHMDALDLPFENALDLVTTFDVLEHIEDDAAVLRRIRDALAPGGVSINVVPQHPWLYSPADARAHHVRRYKTFELKTRMAAVGFDILYDGSFFSLLLPAMAASRWKAKLTGNYHPDDEHDMPGWVNALLAYPQKLELALLRSGLRFPLGGSRVVVGIRKG
jgi:SAM-dependent methyltransferase